MRPILSLAVLAIFGVLTWHALAVLGPGIERRIDAAAEAVAAQQSPHPISVATRGRSVSVSGLADSEAARDALLVRLAALPGVSTVDHRIRVLPLHEPFRFAARRNPGEPLRIEGAAPSAAAERLILDEARTIATGTMLQSALVLAAGAPHPDWTAAVGRALRALGALAEGEIEISGRDGHLAGRAATAQVREAVLADLAADPVLRWEVEVDIILPRAEPYRFRAETGPGGANFSGHAPTEAVRARLAAAAGRLGAGGATGEITLAEGMPGRGWPLMVTRGIDALALLERGVLDVEGSTARLAGRAPTPEAAAEIDRLAGTDIATDLVISDPMPAARLAVEIPASGEGPRLAEGRLPQGLDRDALARALPELDLAGATLETGGRGTGDDWQGAIAALAIALPRLETGRADVAGDRLHIMGRLRAGFSAASTRTALRAAAGSGWTLDLALDEAPQPAEVAVALDSGGVVAASGILPDGIGPEVALVRLRGARNDGLTSGGAGDPLEWRGALDALAAVMPAFATLDARISEGTIGIDGTLAPGETAGTVARTLEAGLPATWRADLAARAPQSPAPAAANPPPDTEPAPGGAATTGGGDATVAPPPASAPAPPPRPRARATDRPGDAARASQTEISR